MYRGNTDEKSLSEIKKLLSKMTSDKKREICLKKKINIRGKEMMLTYRYQLAFMFHRIFQIVKEGRKLWAVEDIIGKIVFFR